MQDNVVEIPTITYLVNCSQRKNFFVILQNQKINKDKLLKAIALFKTFCLCILILFAFLLFQLFKYNVLNYFYLFILSTKKIKSKIISRLNVPAMLEICLKQHSHWTTALYEPFVSIHFLQVAFKKQDC